MIRLHPEKYILVYSEYIDAGDAKTDDRRKCEQNSAHNIIRQKRTRTMWNRSMIASWSVPKKSPKRGPYGGTYRGINLECPKNVLESHENDLEHPKKMC